MSQLHQKMRTLKKRKEENKSQNKRKKQLQKSKPKFSKGNQIEWNLRDNEEYFNFDQNKKILIVYLNLF